MLIVSVYWTLYVVIHVCDNVWSFLAEANLSRFFYCLFLSIVFGDQLSRVICWDTINRFNPTQLLCLSQSKISNAIYRGLVYVQWIEVWGYCSVDWGMRYEVIVQWIEVWGYCSVDWGMRLLVVLLIMLGISVDHHCLNSFFIMFPIAYYSC